MNRSNSFGTQHLLFATHKLLQEVDCDVVIWRQVNAYISGKKVVDFALATVFGIVPESSGVS